MQYVINSQDEMVSLGRDISKTLKPNDVIAMYGDLGSGKTFLARAIIRAICGEDVVVSSPTFNILQTYAVSNYSIYHYDLYRLRFQEEIYELGIEDALNRNITIIEWPEIIDGILPVSRININIISNEEGVRFVEVVRV